MRPRPRSTAAAVHVGHLEEVDGHRGDDAESTLSASERPEQISVVVLGSRDGPVRRCHDVEGADVVAAEPHGPRQGSEPASEEVADHTYTWRRAAERGETVRDRCREDRVPTSNLPPPERCARSR